MNTIKTWERRVFTGQADVGEAMQAAPVEPAQPVNELVEALEYVLDTHFCTGNDGDDARARAHKALANAKAAQPLTKEQVQPVQGQLAPQMRKATRDEKILNSGVYEVPCTAHPDAPHGFNRNASHSSGRYTCDCEGWIPDDEQVQPAQGELPPLPSPVELNPASNSVMGYHEAHLKEYARAALLQSNAELVPLENMTDMQRMEVFNNYCTSCGCKDPRCQCWNDE